MKTAIMPLDGDEFDLDNGVYLRGYSTDQDDWPAAQTVHTWVKEAVEKHTQIHQSIKIPVLELYMKISIILIYQFISWVRIVLEIV